MTTTDERTTEILLDGRYVLGPCLGRGGTAAVYRAEDTVLERTVAIKLLGREQERPSDIARARSETTVLASLNHPSLVTLYDARLDPGHVQYLSIEYVDGPTLATRLTQSPLSGTETAALARDLSDALHVVHTSGIIHRDVKPSNVLLAPNPRRETGWIAKLTDFGIAFSLGDPRKTSPGIVVGTAAYMAPEQVRGADLTPAVDIYSLGLMLIEALTGEPAFPVTGQVQTALRRLVNPPVVPDRLGPAWHALLTRMTSTDPAERPSAAEVAQAAAFLIADPQPQDEDTAPFPAPAALAPLAVGGRTGATEAITAEVPSPVATRRADRRSTHRTARRTDRRKRAAALGAVAAVAAAAFVVAGITLSPGADAPARVASPMQATTVFAPADAEAPVAPEAETPQDSTPADAPTDPATVSTTDTSENTPTDTTNDVSDGVPGNGGAPNPNKGPGNNSGNQEPPGQDKKKK